MKSMVVETTVNHRFPTGSQGQVEFVFKSAEKLLRFSVFGVCVCVSEGNAEDV